MSRKNFQLYPTNERLKQIMIALNIQNLTELAQKLALAYTTVSSWNKRNEIPKPQVLLRTFPELNPNYVISGQYPVLLHSNEALVNQPASIINDLMLSENISNIKKFAQKIDVNESEVRNWLKVKEIPGFYYQKLRKQYPYFFAEQEQETMVVMEPSAEYGKDKIIHDALIDVIADQKKRIAELEKELAAAKKGTKK